MYEQGMLEDLMLKWDFITCADKLYHFIEIILFSPDYKITFFMVC